jgi:hypothetical protein
VFAPVNYPVFAHQQALIQAAFEQLAGLGERLAGAGRLTGQRTGCFEQGMPHLPKWFQERAHAAIQDLPR